MAEFSTHAEIERVATAARDLALTLTGDEEVAGEAARHAGSSFSDLLPVLLIGGPSERFRSAVATPEDASRNRFACVVQTKPSALHHGELITVTVEADDGSVSERLNESLAAEAVLRGKGTTQDLDFYTAPAALRMRASGISRAVALAFSEPTSASYSSASATLVSPLDGFVQRGWEAPGVKGPYLAVVADDGRVVAADQAVTEETDDADRTPGVAHENDRIAAGDGFVPAGSFDEWNSWMHACATAVLAPVADEAAARCFAGVSGMMNEFLDRSLVDAIEACGSTVTPALYNWLKTGDRMRDALRWKALRAQPYLVVHHRSDALPDGTTVTDLIDAGTDVETAFGRRFSTTTDVIASLGAVRASADLGDHLPTDLAVAAAIPPQKLPEAMAGRADIADQWRMLTHTIALWRQVRLEATASPGHIFGDDIRSLRVVMAKQEPIWRRGGNRQRIGRGVDAKTAARLEDAVTAHLLAPLVSDAVGAELPTSEVRACARRARATGSTLITRSLYEGKSILALPDHEHVSAAVARARALIQDSGGNPKDAQGSAGAELRDGLLEIYAPLLSGNPTGLSHAEWAEQAGLVDLAAIVVAHHADAQAPSAPGLR